MCNLYSITTKQAAIIALFRVINRYVGNLPPKTRCGSGTGFDLVPRSPLNAVQMPAKLDSGRSSP